MLYFCQFLIDLDTSKFKVYLLCCSYSCLNLDMSKSHWKIIRTFSWKALILRLLFQNNSIESFVSISTIMYEIKKVVQCTLCKLLSKLYYKSQKRYFLCHVMFKNMFDSKANYLLLKSVKFTNFWSYFYNKSLEFELRRETKLNINIF